MAQWPSSSQSIEFWQDLSLWSQVCCTGTVEIFTLRVRSLQELLLASLLDFRVCVLQQAQMAELQWLLSQVVSPLLLPSHTMVEPSWACLSVDWVCLAFPS